MAAEGCTVMAEDADTGAVIGAFMNEDFCNSDPPGLAAMCEGADGDFSVPFKIIGDLEVSE
jgi:hypothetical protein